MSKNIVVPFVESGNSDMSKGFLVTLSNNVFPIVSIDTALGIEYAHRFWRLMGYQVTDIESRPVSKWMGMSKNTNRIHTSSKSFEMSLNKLPEHVRCEIANVSDVDEYDIDNIGSSDIDDELNKVFSKVTFTFKTLSNIMFYDGKRRNYIEKGRVTFLADNDELEKIQEFYESNSVHYAIVPITMDDIIVYNLKTDQ